MSRSRCVIASTRAKPVSQQAVAIVLTALAVFSAATAAYPDTVVPQSDTAFSPHLANVMTWLSVILRFSHARSPPVTGGRSSIRIAAPNAA
jgi:succinate dehydrogenase hydrophobic anchor subunit